MTKQPPSHEYDGGANDEWPKKMNAQKTKRCLVRHSDFVILSSLDIRHWIRFNVQTQLAQKDYVYVSGGILRREKFVAVKN
jgi:hypothetical protein